jgi:mono/diheme cytochrome c family protein
LKRIHQNITSDPDTGIGAWSDDEIMRAFREGVSRDGHALFPMMPYPYLKAMSDEDAKAVVAYLRTLPPTKKETEPGYVDFPVNLFIKFEPQPIRAPVPHPDPKDTVAYGKYLADMACLDCHTPVDSTMHVVPGKEYSGGREFDISRLVPGMKFASANITPSKETGIGLKSKENFIGMFRAFSDPVFKTGKVDGSSNTLMPWIRLSQMTDEDLGAIYDYLQTVPALENAIERRPLPKFGVADPAAPAP